MVERTVCTGKRKIARVIVPGMISCRMHYKAEPRSFQECIQKVKVKVESESEREDEK